jgi:hypothetical protein
MVKKFLYGTFDISHKYKKIPHEVLRPRNYEVNPTHAIHHVRDVRHVHLSLICFCALLIRTTVPTGYMHAGLTNPPCPRCADNLGKQSSNTIHVCRNHRHHHRLFARSCYIHSFHGMFFPVCPKHFIHDYQRCASMRQW